MRYIIIFASASKISPTSRIFCLFLTDFDLDARQVFKCNISDVFLSKGAKLLNLLA